MPVAVELYAARHVLMGTVEIGRRRLSDYLNDAGVDLVVLEEAWIGDLVQPDAPPGRLSPANFRKQDVILAAALDRLEPAAMRSGYVRTTTISIGASAGPYYVTGDVHLPPGTRFDIRRLFGAGSRTFVPVTNAKLTHLASPTTDAPHPVLLVRADLVEFSGLIGEASASTLPVLGAMLADRLRVLTGRQPPPPQGGSRVV
jgi:hypothetical protein